MTQIGRIQHHVAPHRLTQRDQLLGTVPNAGGGYSFQIDHWTRLERFLILGTDDGSYYASERELTKDNFTALHACINADPSRTLATIVTISTAGRAASNDYAILALAELLTYQDRHDFGAQRHRDAYRRELHAAVPRVCRTGTHLFTLAGLLWDGAKGKGDNVSNFGPGKLKAIRSWFAAQQLGQLAYQMTKYRSRGGWDFARLLRISHPKVTNETVHALFHWALKGWPDVGTEPHADLILVRVWALEMAQRNPKNVSLLVKLIDDHGLVREQLPTEALNFPEVWAALLWNQGKGMPITALIRNLGKMTAVGLIAPLSAGVRAVSSYLADLTRLQKGRVHPITILRALRQYAQGHGDLGKLTWTPDPAVLSALELAFRMSFKTVVPTGKRRLIAVDHSGSMTSGISCMKRGGDGQIRTMNMGLTCREAAMILAQVTVETEEQTYTVGFSSSIRPLPLQRGMTTEEASRQLQVIPTGTDASLPIVWAMQNGVVADSIEMYTDSECNGVGPHVMTALRRYRQQVGLPVKLIVNGMVANGVTVGDPSDGGVLDVVGFDSAAPAVMADFIRGGGETKVETEEAEG